MIDEHVGHWAELTNKAYCYEPCSTINEHTDHWAQLINRAYVSWTGMEVSNRAGVTRGWFSGFTQGYLIK